MNHIAFRCWNAAAVGANGVSPSLPKVGMPFVSAFGTAGAATTLTLQVSEDGATFYDTPAAQTLAGAGDFAIHLTTAARHVRLKSGAAATITAILSADG